MRTLAIGVDGARGGWIAAILGGRSTGPRARRGWKLELRLLERIEELDDLRGAAEVAIDIPIGLPEAIGFRRCDLEAREILGTRRSTVFAAPCRALLRLENYAAVRTWVTKEKARTPGTKGLSAQGAALIAKVAEVDRWLRWLRDAGHDDEDRVFECHPELAFRALNGGGVLPPKRTAAGALCRLDLVSDFFPTAEAAISRLADRKADLTDALDACAALSVAVRRGRGETRELGGGETDACGLSMRMVI